jgi:protein involved in temperature-dependent protein secretion
MTLDDALQQGNYKAAVAMLDTELRASPDPAKLFMSVELRGFLEDFDGALSDLEELDRQLPGRGVSEEFGPVLVNGRVWCRRQTVADFPNRRASLGAELPAYSMEYAEAVRLHARGEFESTRQHLEQVKPQVRPAPGELFFAQGQSIAFADVRDADDLTGPHLVCSHPEALLDIPFAHLAELEFFPGRGFQDMLWKPARVKTWTGEEAFVRVYSYYVGTGGHESEYVRQFRITQCEHEHGYAIGFGQRDWQFLADGDNGGMSLVGIHRVERIDFRQARPG